MCLKHCLPITTYEQRFSSKNKSFEPSIQVLTLAELHIVQLAIVDAKNRNRVQFRYSLRLDALRYAEAFGTTRQMLTNV